MNTLNVVESIFFTALEKETPAARAAYLDEVCQGDANMRRYVERLLNAMPKLDGFLLQSPTPRVDEKPLTIESPPIEERPGTIIGPYKLLQQLGEGGFGVVFMAEQEQPVRRKVALKIIKPGLDSKQVVARFEAERQALALMDHPNIARVFDGGTTESGRPFFVMELVKGIPITEFCDKNRLTPRERLELFIPVCQAVQHAHQKGIIHRDIKPSNVLITMYDDKPVPKVIDFGVAKAIEQKLTDQTLFTRVGQIIGTLEYMSPEQASLNALDVDTRADVYALGVLLYELLTGTTPLNKEKMEGVAFLEMLRLIREVDPPKPSTRLSESGDALSAYAVDRKTESQKLPKLVKGELDWIAMKALEKDRGRRYATANALAADVQRYLKDEQVEACPPTLAYRLQKYARKHKTAFGMAGLAAALLVFGSIVSGWQAVRATRAEGDAVAEQTKAQKERDEAVKARQAEADQRSVAVAAQKKAQEEREKVRRLHYIAALNLIPTAWEADNVKRVLELLDEQRPGAGEKDLRGFEWHFWDRLCHAEQRTLKLEQDSDGRVGLFTFSGDGARIAYFYHSSLKPAVEDENEVIVKVRDIGADREVHSWKFRYAHGVVDLQLNRDGARLAITVRPFPGGGAKRPMRVVVWDVADGKELFVKELFDFRNNFGSPRETALSPDGKLLAVVEPLAARKGGELQKVATDGVDQPGVPKLLSQCVKIWLVADPTREPITLEPESGAMELQFSPDSSRLAGAIQSGPFPNVTTTIRLWDTATGKHQADTTIQGFGPSLAFSADGTRLAALTRGDIIAGPQQTYLWDCASRDELKLLRSTAMAKATTTVTGPQLTFSPDGRHLAVCDFSRGVRILDASTGAEHQALKCRMTTFSAAFSADGARVLTAGYQNVAEMEWGYQTTGCAVQEWVVLPSKDPAPDRGPLDPRPPMELGMWSADGSRQATHSFASKKDEATEIRIRDRAGKQIRVFSEHTARIAGTDFSPDGRLVFSRALNGEVKIWETDSGKVRWEANLATLYIPDREKNAGVAGSPNGIAFSPDGRLVALPSPDGVKIVSTADFQEKSTVEGTSATLFPWPECFFSPDNRRLLILKSPPLSKANTQPPPAGKYKLKLWDVDAGRDIKCTPFKEQLGPGLLRGHHVTFSPDSRMFAVRLARQGAVTIFDAATGKQQSVLNVAGVTSPLSPQGIQFSPDGARVVLQTGVGGPVAPPGPTVWDTATGKLLFRLEGHASPVMLRMAFSPDAKRIATADMRGSIAIKLWDAATGRELLSLKHVQLRFFQAPQFSFSPDGHRLMLQTPDGEGASWDATPRAEAGKLLSQRD